MRDLLYRHRNDKGNLVVLVDHRDGTMAPLEVIEYVKPRRRISHGGFSNIDTAIATFDDVAGTFIA